MDDFEIVIAGEQALQIDFKNEISIETNAYVTQLRKEIDRRNIPGIVEMLQAYRSLIINYKPELIRYSQLKETVEKILQEMTFHYEKPERVFVTEIPVLYGDKWGPDLEDVAQMEGIDPKEVIKRHSTNPNYLYFIGFSPGLPHLGNPEHTFSVPRRQSPRVHLPRGSVTIWREQTTIFPVDQPGGWNVIGRTPLRLFDRNREQSILLTAGQWVQFRPIDRQEYDEIDEQIKQGTYLVKTYWKEHV